MASTILVVLAMTGLGFTLAQSNWDQKARDYILKYHNDRRAVENACRMNKMKYDMDLEAQAKTWAEGCVFAHESIRGRGENIGYTSRIDDEIALADQIAGLWHAETKNYNLTNNTCDGVCGHYTQLVWANTTNVGCYSTRCDFGYYLVCFYTPQGNMNRLRPFTRDCPGAKCAANQVHVNGLCYDEADCPNKNKWCPYWSKYCKVWKYRRYMELNCMKTCGTCDVN